MVHIMDIFVKKNINITKYKKTANLPKVVLHKDFKGIH